MGVRLVKRAITVVCLALWVPYAFAQTGTSSTTLSIDPSASSGTTITAADENDRNGDVTTWANAHLHSLNNSTSWGDGAAGNKSLCANAADTTDACIRWNDTANLWTLDNPTVGTFNQIVTMTGTVGIVSGRILWADGTGSITGTVPSIGFIDMEGVSGNSNTQGIQLPQATSCSSATAEGQLCWDTDDDALSIGSGTADQFGQTIKGWVQFDASTGTPTIADSFNVSSITDNGVGIFIVNWTTAFANAGYACVCTTVEINCETDGITTGGCGVSTRNAADTLTDQNDVSVIAIGDQ